MTRCEAMEIFNARRQEVCAEVRIDPQELGARDDALVVSVRRVLNWELKEMGIPQNVRGVWLGLGAAAANNYDRGGAVQLLKARVIVTAYRDAPEAARQFCIDHGGSLRIIQTGEKRPGVWPLRRKLIRMLGHEMKLPTRYIAEVVRCHISTVKTALDEEG